MYKFFTRVAECLANVIGNPLSLLFLFFFLTISFIIGFYTGYDETWFKLVEFIIYVCTFIVVFVIEISERSDTKAIQHKLDELIKSLPQPDNRKAGIESMLKKGEKLETVLENHKSEDRQKRKTKHG